MKKHISPGGVTYFLPEKDIKIGTRVRVVHTRETTDYVVAFYNGHEGLVIGHSGDEVIVELELFADRTNVVKVNKEFLEILDKE